MFGDISKADQLYIACGYTDMRKSIDGLIYLVQYQLQLNPFQNHLFLFCGRKRDRMKALYWEGDGFVLLYKRLESGQYQWPMDTEAVRSITPQEFRWLLEGLSIHQPKAVKKLGCCSASFLVYPTTFFFLSDLFRLLTVQVLVFVSMNLRRI